MNAMNPTPRAQQGSMLLEALIAILIFSMGILAVVGLQATSIRLSTDAKYRSDASQLANQLIGQMWVSDRTAATLKSTFESGSTYNTWASQVQATLPGVTVANLPTVSVISTAGATQGKVTINVYWQGPNEASRHNYIAIAQIQ
jgi:type IV pilus assembly protein PilV